MSRRRGGFAAFQKQQEQVETAEPESPKKIGEDVLQRSGQSGRASRTLTVEETKALLEALRTAVVLQDFQAALQNLRSRDWGAFKKRTAVARLLAMAWKAPIKSCGLPIDAFVFAEVLSSVRTHAKEPGIRTLSEEVERTLKFFPGDLFGSKAGEMKQTKQGVQVARGAFTASVGGMSEEPPQEAVKDVPKVRARAINLGEAKELLKAFKQSSGSEEFQRTINNLRRRGPVQYKQTMWGFIFQAWAETVKLFDYPTTPEAYTEIALGISKHGWNVHIKAHAHEIEHNLFVEIGSVFHIDLEAGEPQPVYPAPTGGPLEAPSNGSGGNTGGQTYYDDSKRACRFTPGDVVIELTHAVHGQSFKACVSESATFLDVKNAIVEITGKDEILTRGRLVRKNDGSAMFTAWKDQDPIGQLRTIQVLGADLAGCRGYEPRPEPRPARPKSTVADVKGPQLSLEQAIQLQKELRAGFADPAFQNALAMLEQKFADGFDTDTSVKRKFVKARTDLTLTVQKEVLPKYGFEGSPKGVFWMMQAFTPHNESAEIGIVGGEISHLLRLDGSRAPAPAPAAAPEPPPPPPPVEVMLTVRRVTNELAEWCEYAGFDCFSGQDAGSFRCGQNMEAAKQRATSQGFKAFVLFDGTAYFRRQTALECKVALQKAGGGVAVWLCEEENDEIRLKVMSNWNLGWVKDALAKQVTHDSIRRKIKFVSSRDSFQTNLEDTQLVGDETLLLCKGVDSLNLVNREVEITIQHAIVEDAAPVTLNVWTAWTFKEVKDLLARRSGKEEVRKAGRFVFKSGGGNDSWMSYKDTELLGVRRKLSLIGCDMPVLLSDVPIVEEVPTHVEVNIKHAVSQDQVQIMILSNATIRDVKTAVADLLGRRDVLTEGNIVQAQGHIPYLDGDLLGKKRRLLYVGPDLVEASPEAPPAKAPAPAEAPAFRLQDAISLLGRIRQACDQPDIQEKASDPLMVGETFMEACEGPAGESGFGAGEDGLRKMFAALKSFMDDPQVQAHLEGIEELFDLPGGSVVMIADSLMVA